MQQHKKHRLYIKVHKTDAESPFTSGAHQCYNITVSDFPYVEISMRLAPSCAVVDLTRGPGESIEEEVPMAC